MAFLYSLPLLAQNPSGSNDPLDEALIPAEDQSAGVEGSLPVAGQNEQPEGQSGATKKGWASVPQGIKYLAMFIAGLAIYLILQAVLSRWKRSREEVIVHRKDEPGSYPPTSYGKYKTPDRQAPESRPQTPSGGNSSEPESLPRPYEFPRAPRTPSPGQRVPTRKGGFIPVIFFIIILINILRQCIQGD